MLGGLIGRITEYVKLKVQQIKLELVGHLARLMSQILVMLFLVILGLFMMLFLSFATGAYLNEILESNYLGYLIVAGAYFVAFFIIGVLAKSGRIQSWLEAAILRASDQIESEENE
jgi:hypothetical protein